MFIQKIEQPIVIRAAEAVQRVSDGEMQAQLAAQRALLLHIIRAPQDRIGRRSRAAQAGDETADRCDFDLRRGIASSALIQPPRERLRRTPVNSRNFLKSQKIFQAVRRWDSLVDWVLSSKTSF